MPGNTTLRGFIEEYAADGIDRDHKTEVEDEVDAIGEVPGA